jgi:YVTN family beta-propeller protein
MKQIFLLEDGILTYLAFAATADGKKVYVTDSVYNIVSVIDTATGSAAKNLASLQNQKKPSQFGKLIIFIRAKITHKGEKYSIKLKKYYFCNGTRKPVHQSFVFS